MGLGNDALIASLKQDAENEEIPDNPNQKKTGFFQTFLAVIKGHCALVILILPKAFVGGGSVFSPCMIFLSFIFTARCADKLL